MTLRHFSVVVAAALLVSAGARAARAQQDTSASAKPALSTLSDVYTEKQAARGEVTFRNVCLNCHAVSDYTGEVFKTKWVGGTAFDLFEIIRSSMPEHEPGSLSRQQYADLVAYLFKLNDLPAGKTELATDKAGLQAVKIAVKDSTP